MVMDSRGGDGYDYRGRGRYNLGQEGSSRHDDAGDDSSSDQNNPRSRAEGSSSGSYGYRHDSSGSRQHGRESSSQHGSGYHHHHQGYSHCGQGSSSGYGSSRPGHEGRGDNTRGRGIRPHDDDYNRQGQSGYSRGGGYSHRPAGQYSQEPSRPSAAEEGGARSRSSSSSSRPESPPAKRFAHSDMASGSGGPSGEPQASTSAGSISRAERPSRRDDRIELISTKPENVARKQGACGEVIQLFSNYYKMVKKPTWALHQYHVHFEPEETRKFVRRALLRAHEKALGAYHFDGACLYLLTCHKDGFNFTSTRKDDDVQMNIRVVYTKELGPMDYNFLQFFNIVIRKCQGHLKLTEMNRNYYDSAARISVDRHHLELWPGYITSIRQHENDVLLCVDIHHRVLRTDTVNDVIRKATTQRHGDPRRNAVDEVVGCIVITRNNKQTYRVDDIDWDQNPTCTFDMKGTQISYIDYFRQKWNMRIHDVGQPLLISRPKKKDIHRGQTHNIVLVPELCYMTGYTDAMRNDKDLMLAVAQYTRLSPDQRTQALLKFMQRMQQEPEVAKEAATWDLQFDNRLLKVQGRVLEKESLHTMRSDLINTNCDWSQSLRNCSMPVPVPLATWVVIVYRGTSQKALQFVNMVINAARGMGMEIKQPVMQCITSLQTSAFISAIENAYHRQHPQLIMTIVPNNKSELYTAIKKRAYVDYGIPSQVILEKTINPSRRLMNVATKIAIQVNCKLGGVPWRVGISKPCMIVGFDVYHDTCDRKLSVGALVATLNKDMTRYYSISAKHPTLQELSNFISTKLVIALRKYQKCNRQLPQRIIIYRDGVGDGQVGHVYNIELKQVKEKLNELYGDMPYKLAFIIVSKRINTRLFAKDAQGRSINPPPGTVVDDVITLPERYDFFLVPQTSRLGAVSPTSFSIIEDTSGLSIDEIQRLSYKLSHLYFNWSGTVRVPAPCQYAHRLAKLVGECLHAAPHNDLSDVIYYL